MPTPLLLPLVLVSAAAQPVEEPRAVLRRLIGARADDIALRLESGSAKGDWFAYQASGGKLTIAASSKVALCSGFYQYLKAKGLGMSTWSGKRIDLPPKWPDAPRTSASTPFRFRQYFNVVTYGYSMPYWSWERWEKELDWMALHGVNMPIALVGTEAIGTRVWRSLGVTRPEIDAFYTGPAFLPWQRMGNITRHDGPLTDSWNAGQVALQHRILRRMRALGMTHIVPGFSGFVPSGITRVFPAIKLARLSWGGFPADKQSQFLSSETDLFSEISRRFDREWAKEFGTEHYKLVDSFNEMDVPSDPSALNGFLANYGDRVHKTLTATDPKAVWVMQGWMFGYQREIWNPTTVAALLSKVPNDRALVLDMAADYNGVFWRNGMNWDVFSGFYGKPWIYGVIPNMGGKTGYTGVLDFYAAEVFRALGSPKRGQMVGFGMSPEGIENNETIYELLSDLIWRQKPVDLNDWARGYYRARYGKVPDALMHAFALFRQSCYGSFTDHPKFGWQAGRAARGTMTKDPRFVEGVRTFLSCSSDLAGSKLYVNDAVELAAMALGSEAEDLFVAAQNDPAKRAQLWDEACELLLGADRLLESHPTHRLQRWVDFGRAWGSNDAEKLRYESDAKRIVTVWGPPINDYSCRLWSGLIRDFYVPRMRRLLAGEDGAVVRHPGRDAAGSGTRLCHQARL